MLDSLTKQLREAIVLSSEQVVLAVTHLVDEAVPASLKAEFLVAFAAKGETTEEIAAFARQLREKSVPLPLDAETRARDILDVCGTGGDRLNTFNISTTVALIAAAAGITVAKHGNRAITSQAGSADVLEALGVRIDLSPEQAAVFLRDHHFAFLFAPRYHPLFKNIAGARKLHEPRWVIVDDALSAVSERSSIFLVLCSTRPGRPRNWSASRAANYASRWRRCCKRWEYGGEWS